MSVDNNITTIAQSTEGLIHAYLLDGLGGATPLNWVEIEAWESTQGVIWLHLNADHPNTRMWLKKFSGLDSIICEMLLDTDSEPGCIQESDSLNATFRGINFNQESKPEDMVYLNYYSDKNRIISIRSFRLFFIEDITKKLEKNCGPKDAATLLTSILDNLHEKMEPTLDFIEEQLDELEKNVSKFNYIDKTREDLLDLRQEIIELRRFLMPQKNALVHLSKFNLSWLNKKNIRIIKKIEGRIQHFFAELESYRERAIVIKDEINSITNEKMNRAMYMLSIVTGVFLPLGFLTGLLGINVGGMPGMQSKIAFWVVCGILIAVLLLSIVIFKRNRWI